MPQTLQRGSGAPKSFKMTAFQSFSSGFPEGGSPSVSSLAHSGEGGGSSPDMPQALQSSKKLQNECFSKLFIRVSRGGIG